MDNIWAALEIRTLAAGGYVVYGVISYQDRSLSDVRDPIAAFSTLDAALEWMSKHLLRADA